MYNRIADADSLRHLKAHERHPTIAETRPIKRKDNVPAGGVWQNKHIKHRAMQPGVGLAMFEFRKSENADGGYKAKVIHALNFREAVGELNMFYPNWDWIVCYRNGRYYGNYGA